MKGTCITANYSTELKQDQEYFLFPAKPNHYYVSRFDNKGASFGCYEADRFRVIEEEVWPEEPKNDIPQLDREKYYLADLVYIAKGYRGKELKRYVVQPKKTHCMLWHDEERKRPGGCFLIHWFAGFEELSEVQEVQEVVKESQEQELVPLLERPDGQLALF